MRTVHRRLLASLALCALVAPRSATGAASLPVPPPFAHWTFDEPAGPPFADRSGHGRTLTAAPRASAAFTPVPGILGNAVRLAGPHLLRAAHTPDWADLRALTLSAWVRPDSFDTYNEIFRKEDGDRRILFSFQDKGRILALGLNTGTYAECDAPIDPARLLDGRWHHCAATFDGRTLRVFLDGTEAGTLDRPGPLATGGTAPPCVGSSNGRENFAGALDDVRIEPRALAPAEIAALHRAGAPALERFARELDERVARHFVLAPTFGESVLRARQALGRPEATGDPLLAGAIAERLRAAFTSEHDAFFGAIDRAAAEYLRSAEPRLELETAARLVDLLLEYRPLTEEQWQRQSPDEARQWREAEELARAFQSLNARGAEAMRSPEWFRLVTELGRRVRHRPSVQEAVAPYVKPETPPTRDLTPAEGRAALENDWMHQADGTPMPQRIRDEIRWAHALADRLRREYPARFDPSEELRELDALAREAEALDRPDRALYLRVRALKRRIALANPLLDFRRILLVDMPYPQGKEWKHETRHRLGYMAVPGARLLVIDGLAPDARVTRLMPRPPLHGSFWRPDVSWDGTRVLFCFKPHNEKSFHLYEIGADGAGLIQLTDGPYDDLDPIYLPDERRLLFTTTRGHTYVRCMPPTNAFVLARCDRDGRNIYLVSANNEPDYLPSVGDDGRVIYTRWEYTDKPLWRAQGLWTVHPDGTQVNTLWGNQSVWPDVLKDARTIPGTRRVLFTGCGHHDWFAGCVGIVDPACGSNYPDGLTKVTAELPWPESGNGPVDAVESPEYHPSGAYAGYCSPYPLGPRDFLVSTNRAGKFVLYLMDTDGNRELIFEGTHHVFHAMPLRARKRPPVLEDTVAWPGAATARSVPASGTLYSGNVYHGAPAELDGRARALRILSIDHKTYTYWHKRPALSTGPVVSTVQSEGVKRILGTVPIRADGSVSFRAPPGIPLHFQLLDGRGRALQTMRSFVGLMPGERRGCVGCHELHSATPEPAPSSVATAGPAGLAAAQPPGEIEPPPWNDRTVSFPRYVRPLLDRHCARCHAGAGEARKIVDLSFRPGFLDFDETYYHLIGRPTWGKAYEPPPNPPPGFGFADTILVEGYERSDPAAYRTPAPMTRLSYRSRLVELVAGGRHHDVKVDPVALQRLIVWIDAMCPYQGEEEIRAIPDPDFQGIDWLALRPRVRTAPRIDRTGPVE